MDNKVDQWLPKLSIGFLPKSAQLDWCLHKLITSVTITTKVDKQSDKLIKGVSLLKKYIL